MRLAALSLILAVLVVSNSAVGESPQGEEGVYRGHALAMHGSPKYGADFKHFDYVNPNAPKGGSLWMAAIGTYDSLNPFIVKGNAAGLVTNLTMETLMQRSEDEPFSLYPLVAERVAMPDDRSWIEFTLNRKARWHDGSPITVDDVIFSMNTLRRHGGPVFRYYFRDVAKIERTGPRSVRFAFRRGENRELPLIIAVDLTILQKKYWEKREFEQPSLDTPPGSGPYRIKTVDPGRRIVFERVKDHWARDLPVNLGSFNFDTVRVDYFLDATVAREALKAGDYDYRAENTASAWAAAYDSAAVREGLLIKKIVRHQRPVGMQAFVMNTRRTLFKDWRVRRALVYAFDFEWTNRNLFYGQYRRTDSYFENSELAALPGPPKGKVLALLDRYRGRIPNRAFEAPLRMPVYKNGNIRPGLRAAFKLLKEAGWVVRDLKLVNAKTGRPFRFQFLLGSPAFERIVLPLKRNMRRLGIDMNVRLVDQSQWIARVQKFDFDMIGIPMPQSQSPGNEQRFYWKSTTANRPGSRNFIGVRNEAVDELVELIIAAPDRKSLITRTRALDRVLQSYSFVIPNWHINYDRLIFWDKFGLPPGTKRNGIPVFTWWQDPKKAARLRGRISSLPR